MSFFSEDLLNQYVLKINQKLFVEEDTSKNCRNYPNKDFDSYAACDDHYMKSLCNAAGLVPIWLTDDISEVTVQASVNSSGTNVKNFEYFCSQYIEFRM